MAKDKLTDYDSTASGNLDVGGISVAEGMLPSGVNNAIRELMSHQADAFGAGTPLYVDQTNNRLGVGTSSPKTRLQSSAGGILNAPSLGSSSTNAPLYLSNNDTAYGLVVGNSSADGHVWLQAQRTDGTATAYNITLNEAGGNVLVGTTTSGGTIGTYNGFGALSGGTIFSSATSNRSIFARRSTDGSIIDFRKDGTTVGSIGVGNGSSYTYIGTGDTGLMFNNGNDFIQPWNPSTNGNKDNGIDLGRGTSRFKDLYLSGGVYLGGTGAANHLDDYEEGNWTPQFGGSSTTGTGTYSTTVGRYVKVGKKVNCWGVIVSGGTHNGTGNLQIHGLPFTKESTYLSWGTETNIAYHSGFTSYGSFTNVIRLLGPVSNGTYIRFHSFGNTGDTSVPPTPANVQSGTSVYFSATYEVQ